MIIQAMHAGFSNDHCQPRLQQPALETHNQLYRPKGIERLEGMDVSNCGLTVIRLPQLPS
ncbi:hypothetical protein ALP59_102068 [Pseudomonas savastanoi]|uniref:Uncharacterized protein n=1 Tax=Pseudomonas savastanoi TaxID=29438 RepID=A0A3M5FN23_PSESS|nr:hypothetical protein ALO78_101683 [Pseudomonas amygdali pv. ciccaronei]RMS75634.1 hypothetical protein ALP59_102068 [Pseudomonas savastanoi]